MIIRCYGARGSIAVSGAGYLKYGGDTTSIEIRTKNDEIILIDAGSGIRVLGNRLLAERRFKYSLLFTHSHWDHILGFPFFKPVYESDTVIDLIGCSSAQGNIYKLISKTMATPYFPVPFDQLRARINYSGDCQQRFRIDSIDIHPIAISHPNMGLGFKFVEDGRSFVFLTDNELGYSHPGGRPIGEYVEFARNADLLIHDAEYSPEQYRITRGWGHSQYTEAMELALDAGVKSFGLFHHNQDRFDEEEDAIVEECREIARKRKVDMECFALTQTSEIEL